MAKDIRTREMIAADADPSVEYAFPLRSRGEMVNYLADHESYGDHGFYLSWDIKVRNLDVTGRAGGEKVDPAFDDKWSEYVRSEAGNELFGLACEDALAPYVDGSYTVHPGGRHPAAAFMTAGRSGGHLCLKEWKAGPADHDKIDMRFDSRAQYVKWLGLLEDKRLAALYVLVENVSRDTAVPSREVACHLNLRRAEMEREWAGEMAPALM